MNEKKYSFPQKIWILGGILGLIIVLLLFVNSIFGILFLVIAGVLISAYFHGVSDFIEKKTKCKPAVALTISVFGTLIIAALIFWLIGAKVQSQVAQLIDSLPSLFQTLKKQISQGPIGQRLLGFFSATNPQFNLKSIATSFLSTTFGFLGDIYVILIIAIYLTATPHLYKKGIVKLVPVAGRKKADETLSKLGHALKEWLKGKLFSMLLIFVLLAIGLKIIGLSMWLTLALIAGLLNFIPNFGPIIAAIPAILIALTISPASAWIVASLYLVVQTAEGAFITPRIQQHMVNIAPALLIVSQVIIAALTGFWGLVYAAPLLVIITVLVKELYIKRMDKKAAA